MSNNQYVFNDTGSVIHANAVTQPDILFVAGAPRTLLAGTILARAISGFNAGQLVPFVIGGVVDGNGIPVAVLTYDVETTTTDELVSIGAAISGQFVKQRLVVDADGDDSNINKLVEDDLRHYGLIPISSPQLSGLDNPGNV